MITKLRYLIVAGTFALAIPSMALILMGPRVGNGGGGWICRDAETNQIQWIQLVDLFEISETGHVPASTGNLSAREILEKQRQFLQLHIGRLAPFVSVPDVPVVFTPAPTALTIIDDGAYRVRPNPSSCEGGYIDYVQLANFTDDGRLLIHGGLWQHPDFGTLNQGALLTHELVYRALRDSAGDRNSWRARQIVGLLFSEMTRWEKVRLIEDVLAQPAPKMPESAVSLGSTKVDCQVSLSRNGVTVSSESLFPLHAGRVALQREGLEFGMNSSLVDGLPLLMEITDQNRKVRVTIEKEQIDYLFATRGSATLTYEDLDGNWRAAFRCGTTPVKRARRP